MLMLGNPTQQQNKLAGKQMTVTALPLEPPRPEPAPEAERILMVDFTTTYAWAKGAAPSANFEGGGVDWGRCDQDPERLTFTHH
jgi:hypothetical protein